MLYDASVLEPRPWTTLQAEWAVELGSAVDPARALAVELCCGVGHIGQAAIAALADWQLVQVDIDPHACELARANAAANGLADRVEVRAGDIATALRPGESFAVVLADPPYLPTDEVEAWPADPVAAVDGGADGLRLLERCLDTAARHVAPDGAVLMQVRGARQAVALRPTAHELGLEAGEVREHDSDRAVAFFRPYVG